eukprot:215350-Amorphochlora_amoeboformis.AAC.1
MIHECSQSIFEAVVKGSTTRLDYLTRSLGAKRTFFINKVQDENGRRLLQVACEYGQLDVTRWLVESKASLRTQDQKGDNPVIIACRNGNLGVVRLLLESRANVNAQSRFGSHKPLQEHDSISFSSHPV